VCGGTTVLMGQGIITLHPTISASATCVYTSVACAGGAVQGSMERVQSGREIKFLWSHGIFTVRKLPTTPPQRHPPRGHHPWLLTRSNSIYNPLRYSVLAMQNMVTAAADAPPLCIRKMHCSTQRTVSLSLSRRRRVATTIPPYISE